jgi:polysaccharide transporter, PST family
MSDSWLTENRTRVSLARNFGWSALAQAWSVALSFVSAVVLARLLAPTDYAVLAIITPIIGVAQNLQALGFGNAIVQTHKISKPQLDALFAISFAVSLVLVITISLLAQSVAKVMHDPRIAPVLLVATASIVAMALAAQPAALLSRAMRFKAIALRNMISTTAGFLAAIATAIMTRSYWALIVSMITIPSLNFILSMNLVNWRPGIPRKGSEAGQLVRFGFNLWAANLSNFATRNADNLIVGHFSSTRDLGLYDRSYRVLLFPLGQAVLPLGQVLIPIMSRSLDDSARYREYYWRSILLLLFTCLPGLTLCVINPATIFGLLLGEAWLDGAPMFGWFASAGLFQIFLTTTSWLFISQGRGREFRQVSLSSSLVALASFLIGVRWGILGVAQAYVIGQALIVLPLTLWFAGRTGPVDYRNLAVGLLPHGLAITASLIFVWLLHYAFGRPLWPLLLLTGIGAYLAYAAMLLIMPSSRRLVFGIGKRLLGAVQRELGMRYE